MKTSFIAFKIQVLKYFLMEHWMICQKEIKQTSGILTIILSKNVSSVSLSSRLNGLMQKKQNAVRENVQINGDQSGVLVRRTPIGKAEDFSKKIMDTIWLGLVKHINMNILLFGRIIT